MPGFYQEGEYDVAGFAVGSVKQDAVIDGKSIAEGDVVLGLPSSGVHSNGFSLVRKVLEVRKKPAYVLRLIAFKFCVEYDFFIEELDVMRWQKPLETLCVWQSRAQGPGGGRRGV